MKTTLCRLLVVGCGLWALGAPARADEEADRRQALVKAHRPSLVRVRARVRVQIARLPGVGSGARRAHEVSVAGVVVGAKGLIAFPASGLDPARAAYEALGATGPVEVTRLDVVGGDGKIRSANWLGRDQATGLAFAQVEGAANMTPVAFAKTSAGLGAPLDLVYLSTQHYKNLPALECARVAVAAPGELALTPRLPHALGALALDASGKAIGLLLPASTPPATLLRPDLLAEAAAGRVVLAAEFAKVVAEPPRETSAATSLRRASAWLGVSSRVLSEGLAKSLGLDVEVGVVVDTVHPGPGQAAGLKPRDVILRLDGEPLDLDPEAESLDDLIRDYAPGEEVELLIRRAGKNSKQTVRLGKSPTRPEEAERLRIQPVGLSLRALTFFDRAPHKLDEEQAGAVVVDLDPDGAASRAGVRVGDVVLGVGEEPIGGLADLQRLLLRDGAQPLKIRRAGKDLTLRVRR